MKKALLVTGVVLVMLLAIVISIFKGVRKAEIVTTITAVKTSLEKIQSIPTFSKPLETIQSIGFGNFSPDGRYFAYSAFTPNGNPPNNGHVVDLKTGQSEGLDAMLSRGFRDNDYLTISRDGNLSVYDPVKDREVSVSKDRHAFDAFVSPDGNHAAINGTSFSIADLKNGTETVLDAKPASGGYAWFSDSNRIVGFKQNNENLFEAGKGRDLGIWNIADKSFSKIPVTIPVKTIRYAEWLVPDHVVRVNAGYDDGSHDYIVNLDANSVVDLGDTSGALMSGIALDSRLGVMAVVNAGGPGDCGGGECNGFIADRQGIMRKFVLRRDHYRSNIQIVSRTKIIYVRRDLGEESGYGATGVFEYDTETGTETHLADIPNTNIVTLAISPDKSVWVAGAGNQFFAGSVE